MLESKFCRNQKIKSKFITCFQLCTYLGFFPLIVVNSFIFFKMKKWKKMNLIIHIIIKIISFLYDNPMYDWNFIL